MDDNGKTKRSARYYTVMIWIGLVVGCMAKIVSGSLFVFNAYSGALKATFNFTGKEVQLQSSFLNIGLGVGFLPGMFYDRFGPQWASGVGLGVSLVAYLLLWSTNRSVDFYSSNAWLMTLYFFLCGLGSVFTFMVALNTNAINFHEKHRGKIIGLLNAFFAGSPSIFSSIYFHVIGKDDPNSGDSFATLMLVFAVGFTFVDIICIIFMRAYPRGDSIDTHGENEDKRVSTNKISIEDEREMQVNPVDYSIPENTTNSDDIGNAHMSSVDFIVPDDNNGSKKMTFLAILRDVDFQLLTWMFTLASVAGLVYTVTLTQTTGSLHLDKHDADIVLVIPVTNAIVSASIGIISDYYRSRLPRLAILLAGIVAFVVCQGMVVGKADVYEVLFVATVFNGVGQGIVWSLSPAVMSEMFRIENLGRNWGMALFTSSLVGLGAMEAFGALYDNAIDTPGNIFCYGMACVRGGHAVALGLAVLALILGVILSVRKRKTK